MWGYTALHELTVLGTWSAHAVRADGEAHSLPRALLIVLVL